MSKLKKLEQLVLLCTCELSMIDFDCSYYSTRSLVIPYNLLCMVDEEK